MVEYVATRKPKMFILENVQGLSSIDGGAVMMNLLTELKCEGQYAVHARCLNTLWHGLPQSRKRWFIVGVLAEHAGVCV